MWLSNHFRRNLTLTNLMTQPMFVARMPQQFKRSGVNSPYVLLDRLLTKQGPACGPQRPLKRRLRTGELAEVAEQESTKWMRDDAEVGRELAILCRHLDELRTVDFMGKFKPESDRRGRSAMRPLEALVEEMGQLQQLHRATGMYFQLMSTNGAWVQHDVRTHVLDALKAKRRELVEDCDLSQQQRKEFLVHIAKLRKVYQNEAEAADAEFDAPVAKGGQRMDVRRFVHDTSLREVSRRVHDFYEAYEKAVEPLRNEWTNRDRGAERPGPPVDPSAARDEPAAARAGGDDARRGLGHAGGQGGAGAAAVPPLQGAGVRGLPGPASPKATQTPLLQLSLHDWRKAVKELDPEASTGLCSDITTMYFDDEQAKVQGAEGTVDRVDLPLWARAGYRAAQGPGARAQERGQAVARVGEEGPAPRGARPALRPGGAVSAAARGLAVAVCVVGEAVLHDPLAPRPGGVVGAARRECGGVRGVCAATEPNGVRAVQAAAHGRGHAQGRSDGRANRCLYRGARCRR